MSVARLKLDEIAFLKRRELPTVLETSKNLSSSKGSQMMSVVKYPNSVTTFNLAGDDALLGGPRLPQQRADLFLDAGARQRSGACLVGARHWKIEEGTQFPKAAMICLRDPEAYWRAHIVQANERRRVHRRFLPYRWVHPSRWSCGLGPGGRGKRNRVGRQNGLPFEESCLLVDAREHVFEPTTLSEGPKNR